MDEKGMVMEIAERLLLREAEIKALKTVIEHLPDSPSGQRLDRELFQLVSQIQTDETYRQRVAELQRKFEAQTAPTILIRTLHAEALYGMSVS